MATTAALASGLPSGAGGIGGTGAFTGAPAAVDGITLADGDRVLVKNQADAKQNGIYKVVDAANGVWDRATDFDPNAEVTSVLPRLRQQRDRQRRQDLRSRRRQAWRLEYQQHCVLAKCAANPVVRVATTGNLAARAVLGPPDHRHCPDRRRARDRWGLPWR